MGMTAFWPSRFGIVGTQFIPIWEGKSQLANYRALNFDVWNILVFLYGYSVLDWSRWKRIVLWILQISCWGKHFIGLDYLLCVNTQHWKPWQWRGELISSGGTDPGFVCRGGTQLHFSLFLSLSVTPLLHQGHFQPQSFPLILFTTPSFSLPHTLCHSYTLSCFFFPSDTQFFFPFISEYIVASGCECALSTCCNLDRCSLPLSLYLSLSPSLLVLLYFCILAVVGLYFSPPASSGSFPLCDVRCGSGWANGHPFMYLSFCGWALGET